VPVVITKEIHLSTRGNGDVIDVTPAIARHISDSGLQAGVVTLFSPSSTSALTTIEFESGAVHDLQRLFDRIVPPDADYEHNLRWGDGNGHAHVRHALLGPSLAVPFSGRQLMLGTWQQVVLVDFDNRPRSRSIVVQIMGE
jgi:secondary thiamine-phosphate synthase enzyme